MCADSAWFQFPFISIALKHISYFHHIRMQRGDWALMLLVEIAPELFEPSNGPAESSSSFSSSSSSSSSFSTTSSSSSSSSFSSSSSSSSLSLVDEQVHLLHVALLGAGDHRAPLMREQCRRLLATLVVVNARAAALAAGANGCGGDGDGGMTAQGMWCGAVWW